MTWFRCRHGCSLAAVIIGPVMILPHCPYHAQVVMVEIPRAG